MEKGRRELHKYIRGPEAQRAIAMLELSVPRRVGGRGSGVQVEAGRPTGSSWASRGVWLCPQSREWVLKDLEPELHRRILLWKTHRQWFVEREGGRRGGVR